VPEDIRRGINPIKVAAFLFGQRGVKFEEFLFTQEELQSQQQTEQAQQEQMMQQEVAAKAATQPTE
jgi:hypothetical protein